MITLQQEGYSKLLLMQNFEESIKKFFNILKVQFKIMTKKWGFNVALFNVFIFCISSYLNNAFISVKEDETFIYESFTKYGNDYN